MTQALYPVLSPLHRQDNVMSQPAQLVFGSIMMAYPATFLHSASGMLPFLVLSLCAWPVCAVSRVRFIHWRDARIHDVLQTARSKLSIDGHPKLIGKWQG